MKDYKKIEDFFLAEYDTLLKFSQELDNRNTFAGYAMYNQNSTTPSSRYHIMLLNGRVYATQEIENDEGNDENKFNFTNLYEVKPSFLQSDVFKYGGNSKFTNFETQLPVQINLYEYSSETKLMINYMDKVDLLYSLHLTPNSYGNFVILDGRGYPSLENAIKRNKIMTQLDERCLEIISKKSRR